ncbi:hypothetical protein [Rheinheimera faecalis]|uniref:hypothetical protein n=1 Tax=Rheinheimera faecalis TaxID=2901141 RepID=UPI001E3F85CC|nr:hypothetical protein [Rheinheimera faecalis]
MDDLAFKTDNEFDSYRIIVIILFLLMLAAIAYWLKKRGNNLNKTLPQLKTEITSLGKNRFIVKITNDGYEYLLYESSYGVEKLNVKVTDAGMK